VSKTSKVAISLDAAIVRASFAYDLDRTFQTYPMILLLYRYLKWLPRNNSIHDRPLTLLFSVAAAERCATTFHSDQYPCCILSRPTMHIPISSIFHQTLFEGFSPRTVPETLRYPLPTRFHIPESTPPQTKSTNTQISRFHDVAQYTSSPSSLVEPSQVFGFEIPC
jgi:hypothetical protein